MAVPHLTFLNNTSSWLFFGLFSVFLFLTTGLFWIAISFIAALALTTLARTYVPAVNTLLPVPRNRAILITGCSTGIGFDSALYFASQQQGFTVFAGVRKQEDVQKLISSFSSVYGSASSSSLIPVLIDVSDSKSVKDAVVTISGVLKERQISLHSIILNAGYAEAGVLELQPLARIRAQLDVNVVGQIACVQAFTPLLRQATRAEQNTIYQPRIIWVSSGVGELSIPGSAIYSASKHAVEALSQCLDIELTKWGIKSIAVQPGAIATSFMATARGTRASALTEATEAIKSSSGSDSGSDVDDVLGHYKLCTERSNSRTPTFATTQVVIDAFTSALLDSNPLPCYKAGNDVQIVMPLSKILPPNALVERMMRKLFA